MSQSKYNKLEKHPRTKEWEESGVATLTEDEAATLNSNTQFTGVKYEKAEKEDSPKLIKIGEKEFEKGSVIDALLAVEVKLNKNTGIKKTQEAVDALNEDGIEAIIEALEK